MHGGDVTGGQLGDRYRLVVPIGEGGLGTVWEAEDAVLARRVAVKLLTPEARLLPAQLERVEREARVAAALDHDHVVRVLDYGVDGALGPFIVMELLRGRTLEDELLERGSLRLREVIGWLEPIARALDAIHAAGLVHRDIKPTNIMRAERDDGTAVKLLDFGLAAYRDGRERLTRQGLVVGTPEYMAPEVAEGEIPSGASDVYSLAVVAFEAMTGKLPHQGETAIDFLAAKSSQRAATLSETTGRIFTLRLEEAFADALEPDPSERVQAATQFIAALAACVR